MFMFRHFVACYLPFCNRESSIFNVESAVRATRVCALKYCAALPKRLVSFGNGNPQRALLARYAATAWVN